jgi:hypothetical protein
MAIIRNNNELKCPKIGCKRLGWYVCTLLFIPIIGLSEVRVTDNLINNSTFEQGNSNGWTTSGDVQVINDCCGSTYDLEFGDSGSIEQSFSLSNDDITQTMLDNGITLNSNVQVQNGEGGEGGWAYNKGGADSFTIRLQIKDANSNILNSVTQTRTNTTDINGEYFTNSVSYTGTGSNIGDIKISGTDANAPAYLGGANIDNVSVTMTYDDTVLSAIQTQQIATTFTELEEMIELTEEFIPEEIENLVIEKLVFEELITELPEIIEIIEFSAEEEFIEETIVLAPEFLEEPVMIESQISEEIVEESVQVAEEVFEEIVEAPVEEQATVEEVNATEEEIVSENVGTGEGEIETETAESNEVVSEEVAENNTEEIEETETDTETNQDSGDVVEQTEVAEDNSGSSETQLNIDIADISVKVAEKIKTTEGQLKAVSLIVAKVMSKNNNKIDSYSQVNAEIFKQPVIMDRNIDSYFSQTYVDVRNIYNDRTYEDRQDWISR